MRTMAMLVLGATILLQGCALLTTDVKGPQSPCVGRLVHSDDRLLAEEATCNVDNALAYASGWRLRFLSAAGEHSFARSAAGLVVLPTAAVALYYGVSGKGSAARIAGLSSGGALAYGTASYLATPGKQNAYLEGAVALSCAMDIGAGLRRSADSSDALSNAIDKVKRASVVLAAVMHDRAKDLPASSVYTTNAIIALGDASNILTRANNELVARQNAGWRLTFAVDRIVSKTEQNVTNQETSLESLLTIAGSLRQTATTLGMPAVSSSGAGDAATAKTHAGILDNQAAVQESRDAEQEIKDATTQLVVATQYLRLELVGLAAIEDASYGSCDPNPNAPKFSVDPVDSAQTLELGATMSFTVKGSSISVNGSKIENLPIGSTSGPGADAIAVSPAQLIDGQLKISSKGVKVTSSTPVTLTISDPGSRSTKTYQISVTPAHSAQTESVVAKTVVAKAINKAVAGENLPTISSGFKPGDIRNLQCHLGMRGAKADGVYGRGTAEALNGYRQQHPGAPAQLDQKLFDMVISDPANPDSCANAVQ